jgi:hypothetical protein
VPIRLIANLVSTTFVLYELINIKSAHSFAVIVPYVSSPHATITLLNDVHTDIAVAWEALFTFDLLIFSLTLAKTYKERLRYGFEQRLDLVGLMVRDGK